MMADACMLACRKIVINDEWVPICDDVNGQREGVLFISTELDDSELFTLALSFISNINEEKIISRQLTPQEFEILNQAKEELRDAPLFFKQLPNFTVSDVENTIKKAHIQDKCNYIFYDYLSTSLGILEEVGGKAKISNMREDSVLYLLSTRLKELAVQYNIFIEVRNKTNEYLNSILKMARVISIIDVYSSLACLAKEYNYVKPIITNDGIIDIKDGRHPVVEVNLKTESFIPNDTYLDNKNEHLLIITGGRGTSTYDGLSIAWAIVEYLVHEENKKAKTLFATHYHELTMLEDLEGVKNYKVLVEEYKDEIIFMKKVTEGAAQSSYGIYAAKIAGAPNKVIKRATEILKKLEADASIQVENIELNTQKSKDILPLYEEPKIIEKESEIENEIRDLNINEITPIDALNLINKWKKSL